MVMLTVTQISDFPAVPSYSNSDYQYLGSRRMAPRDLAIKVICLSQTIAGILGNFSFIMMSSLTSEDAG